MAVFRLFLECCYCCAAALESENIHSLFKLFELAESYGSSFVLQLTKETIVKQLNPDSSRAILVDLLACCTWMQEYRLCSDDIQYLRSVVVSQVVEQKLHENRDLTVQQLLAVLCATRFDEDTRYQSVISYIVFKETTENTTITEEDKLQLLSSLRLPMVSAVMLASLRKKTTVPPSIQHRYIQAMRWQLSGSDDALRDDEMVSQNMYEARTYGEEAQGTYPTLRCINCTLQRHTGAHASTKLADFDLTSLL